MSYKRFSVIIPLYNKQAEIGATIASILNQTLVPDEIIVVDDGSTDGSYDVVRGFDSPLIELITQQNAGECAARNRAIEEAQGEYIALLDADDSWAPEYLATIDTLIRKYPGCGVYSSGCMICSAESKTLYKPAVNNEGIIDNYFLQAHHGFICLPSSSTIPKAVFDTVGGFPNGMKLGGDQYMWVKIASQFKVCFTPAPLLHYNVAAANRSASIYTPEQTAFSFREFYDPAQPDRNEYIARCEIGKAIDISAKGGTKYAAEVEKFYSYTHLNRRSWYRLWLINRLPTSMRWQALNLFNRIAWVLSKKV